MIPPRAVYGRRQRARATRQNMDPHEPVTVHIETPLGGFVKRRADGRIAYVSPVPCPFNYGSVPGRWSADGDPLDAVVLGSRHPRAAQVSLRPWAWVDFIDNGERDPKLVCAERAPTRAERVLILAFFQLYARVKVLARLARGSRGPTECRGWRELASLEDEVSPGEPDTPWSA